MIDDSNDKEKTYIITTKFKVSGILPSFIKTEHIEANIQSAIEDAVGEIALSSEYYDMEDDIEWAVYLKGNVNMLDTKEIAVHICEEPFCEHCGERYQDFGIEIFDGGTSWCMGCFLSNDSGTFSEKEIDEIYKEEKRLRRKHLLKLLKELDDE